MASKKPVKKVAKSVMKKPVKKPKLTSKQKGVDGKPRPAAKKPIATKKPSRKPIRPIDMPGLFGGLPSNNLEGPGDDTPSRLNAPKRSIKPTNTAPPKAGTPTAPATGSEPQGKPTPARKADRPAETAGNGSAPVPQSAAQPATAAGKDTKLGNLVNDKLQGLSSAFAARMSEKETTDDAPHLIIEARAGTGKTTTLVCGLQIVKGIEPHVLVKHPDTGVMENKRIAPSEQQKAVWDRLAMTPRSASICMAAFNSSIASVLKDRVPEGCSAMTMHSMGYKAVTNQFGYLKPNKFTTRDLIAGITGYSLDYLMKNKPVVLAATEDLVSLAKTNLVSVEQSSWDEELGKLADYYEIELNGSRKEVFELVPQVLERAKNPVGRITFDDQIWLPIVLNLPLTRYDLLLIDEAQDLNRCQQALAKQAGERLVFCGDPCQCLLPGTLITLEKGVQIPIEELVEQEKGGLRSRLSTFNPNAGRISGRNTQGRLHEASSVQDYEGDIVRIEAGGNSVDSTLSHRWWVRFSPSCKSKYVVYLMERNDQFRVGICKMQYSCGMGVSARARSEDADRAWILQVYDDLAEARLVEELVSVQDGLPQLMFRYRGPEDIQVLIESFYGELGSNRDRAEKTLASFGRDIAFPVWEKRGERRYNYLSVTKGFVAHSINLIDGCFQVRVDDGSVGGQWKDANISRREYKGKVYGITVEPTERDLRLYLANNIVSHNSIYGFAGADVLSMKRLEAELKDTKRGCEHLMLTVTYRCGKAIVEEARKIVPEFSAHESNPQGRICTAKYPVQHSDGQRTDLELDKTYIPSVKEGDMVLCRVNAPLVSQCFRFLKMGKKAFIQGRDIGRGLKSTITKLKPDSIQDLTSKLADWMEKEISKERAKKHPNDARVISIEDRVDCIYAFMEGLDTVDKLLARIDATFSDKVCPKCGQQADERQEQCYGCKVPLVRPKGIRISSIHKAKGLESSNVFFLMPRGGECPHPMAKSPWQREQEMNLKYVAITRAIDTLTYVT